MRNKKQPKYIIGIDEVGRAAKGEPRRSVKMLGKRRNLAGYKFIVGIDEVGRGPLAGPVAVGAVVCSSAASRRGLFADIEDSKKLSARKREEWEGKIKNKKLNMKIAVCFVGNETIDKKGIVGAIGIAIKRALKKLEREAGINPKNCLVLLDGSLKAPDEYRQETIIKGDEKIPVISAASIIAKVARDRKMIRFHKKFPNYAFERHKGYGTKLHYKMIKKHGICEIHRKSFLKSLGYARPPRFAGNAGAAKAK